VRATKECGRSSTGRNRAPAAPVGGPPVPVIRRNILQTARARAIRWFARGFYACGDAGLPPCIDYRGGRYTLRKTLKHDFVAATGLYENVVPDTELPRRLVCKINRRTHFCLIPLGLIGRFVARSEIRNLRRCRGMRGVPNVLARLDAHTYVYPYIEGRSLSEGPALPAGFFDDLLGVTRQIHARNLVHFDLNKPGNILLGDDGRAYVLDFQISAHIGARFLLSKRLSARLRRHLQTYDIYHVYKHKRRFQPQLLTEAEERLSRNHSLLLTLQRAVAWAYKRIRRPCLRYLHLKGILTPGDNARACAETDPVRWTGK
jgi:hypothetical protein